MCARMHMLTHTTSSALVLRHRCDNFASVFHFHGNSRIKLRSSGTYVWSQVSLPASHLIDPWLLFVTIVEIFVVVSAFELSI